MRYTTPMDATPERADHDGTPLLDAGFVPAPPGGPRRARGLPQAQEQERRRLLLRLQADIERAVVDTAALRVETRRLLALEAQRPLTAAEAERARVLNQVARRLYYHHQQLRAEFERLRASH